MGAAEFCADRVRAIREYGLGRRTKWEVLGTGTVDDLGAVRIKDAYGNEGLLIQGMRNGGTVALPISGILPRYIESATA